MRLVEAGVKGRHLTLKIKRKKAGAPEPVKFLVLGPYLRMALCSTALLPRLPCTPTFERKMC